MYIGLPVSALLLAIVYHFTKSFLFCEIAINRRQRQFDGIPFREQVSITHRRLQPRMAKKLNEPDLQLLKTFFAPLFSLNVTFISVEDAKNVQVFKKIAVLVMRIIGGGGGDGGLKNGEIFGIILKN
jgi:hypothetical protein